MEKIHFVIFIFFFLSPNPISSEDNGQNNVLQQPSSDSLPPLESSALLDNSLVPGLNNEVMNSLSTDGKKGKEPVEEYIKDAKKLAPDAVNTFSKNKVSNCGRGLKVTKDTQSSTLMAMRSINYEHLDGDDVLMSRVAKGNQTTVPWQVYFREKGTSTPHCGGSILNKRWLLTAQHCEMDADNYEAFFGDTAPGLKDKGMDFEQVINHKGYIEKFHYNDFTLVKLKSSIKFSKSVGPVCLPRAGTDFSNTKALASGWGHSVDGTGPFPKHLLSATLTILTRTNCNKYFNEHNELDLKKNRQICALVDNKSQLCEGDSGGPMVVRTYKNRYIQVGVVSATYSACGKPIIFGEVADPKIISWITSNAFGKQ